MLIINQTVDATVFIASGCLNSLAVLATIRLYPIPINPFSKILLFILYTDAIDALSVALRYLANLYLTTNNDQPTALFLRKFAVWIGYWMLDTYFFLGIALAIITLNIVKFGGSMLRIRWQLISVICLLLGLLMTIWSSLFTFTIWNVIWRSALLLILLVSYILALVELHVQQKQRLGSLTDATPFLRQRSASSVNTMMKNMIVSFMIINFTMFIPWFLRIYMYNVEDVRVDILGLIYELLIVYRGLLHAFLLLRVYKFKRSYSSMIAAPCLSDGLYSEDPPTQQCSSHFSSHFDVICMSNGNHPYVALPRLDLGHSISG
ncbi:hypothetical protein BC833DRAFT_585282 [Globomyces pollinis-pini]|nr:hypothetical protein BC833DRAFT_585282 [Globomyces pollinis-pini]